MSTVSSKKIHNTLSIIAVGLLVGFSIQFARAWTNPTAAPPGGVVPEAPITTSQVAQMKEGALAVNMGWDTNADTIPDQWASNGLLIPHGNVGIGITPTHRLHVSGRIQATGDVCTNLSGGKCLSTLTSTPVPTACGANQASKWDGNSWTCVNFPPIPPSCGSGTATRWDGSSWSCVAVTGGGTTPPPTYYWVPVGSGSLASVGLNCSSCNVTGQVCTVPNTYCRKGPSCSGGTIEFRCQ